MNLRQTLEQIMRDFNLPGYEDDFPDEDLQRPFPEWAHEDPHTGWDLDQGGWRVGSIWGVEGKILYSLVRYARPTKVLEIGTAEGCSATHIAQALKDNGHGKLICLDKGINAGSKIPKHLRAYWTLQAVDEHIALATEQPNVDFIFEDGEHSAVAVEKVVRMAMDKLTPGGWLVSHDALHFLAGEAIMQGWRNAGLTPHTYLTEPSDCGLAIFRQPLDTPAPEPEVEAAVEVAPLAERVKTMRKTTRKKDLVNG